MSRQLLLGALLATIVLMAWGFVSWGLLADKLGIVRALDNEVTVMALMRDQVPETGVYFFPMAGFQQGTDEAVAAWEEAHTNGPVGFLSILPRGIAPNMGKVLGMGAVHFFLSALLAGWVLTLVRPAEYAARAKLVAAIGLFTAFATQLTPSIWWYFPWSYSVFALFSTAIGWGLAGLVLARFVTPAEPA